MLRPTLGEHIEIDALRAADVSRALVDPNLLMTTILNLAVIARDAMPEGGNLTFETRNAVSGDRCAGVEHEIGRLDTGVLLLAKPYRKVDLAKMIRAALAA